MKRTNSVWRFAAGNRRLLLMLMLVLLGCMAGVALYASLREELPPAVMQLLTLQPITGGIGAAFSQLLSSCFQPVCLLIVLFLSGLSACGAPMVFIVPLFWGIGLGLTQAHYYAQGAVGILLSAVLILPPCILKSAALLIGCSQSLQLSLQLSGQLLPRGAHCGGLWQDFRLYCFRVLLLLPLVLAGGALDVGLRVLLLRFFGGSY